jgi:hypothetical protein
VRLSVELDALFLSNAGQVMAMGPTVGPQSTRFTSASKTLDIGFDEVPYDNGLRPKNVVVLARMVVFVNSVKERCRNDGSAPQLALTKGLARTHLVATHFSPRSTGLLECSDA